MRNSDGRLMRMAVVTLCLGAVLWSGGIAESGQNDWENPGVIGINKLPPRATLLPYADVETALEANRDASPYFKSLNGSWKFHWVAEPSQKPAGFHQPSGTSTNRSGS